MQSRIYTGVIVLLVIVSSVMTACGGATEPVEPTEVPAEEPTEAPASIDAEALLQDRCTDCHGLDQTTGAQKSQEEWEQTVDRMVDKGAKLNDEEKAALIDYLAANYGP